ncbi:cobalamin B12-binding domain-containing protein [Streptomyces tendae]|uniref:cobalamin B12-binding domain-containing protein n=1 Tax=Streptomyces tendae TaxID=1932 RepID=UPI0036CE87A7
MSDTAAVVTTAREQPPQRTKGTVVVTTVASDSHTWNLVYLQLLIEELGYRVVNLGPCVPDDLLVRECLETRPDLLVISSVNGHGHQDGMRVIRLLRDQPELVAVPAVIGGKLGVTGETDGLAEELTAAGFDAVFPDGADPMTAFRSFVAVLENSALPVGDRSPAVPRITA